MRTRPLPLRCLLLTTSLLSAAALGAESSAQRLSEVGHVLNSGSPTASSGAATIPMLQSGVVVVLSWPALINGDCLTNNGSTLSWVPCGSMVYPGAGIPNSTGTAWGTSYSTTGTGNVVLSTSPTLTTPNLGTPSALTLTNATGLPIAGLSGLGAGMSGFLALAWPALINGNCLTNNGTALSWGSCGTGSGITLQTNGTNNTSQTTLNLQSGSAVDGITPTVSNPSAGNAQLGLTVNAANLQSALISANAITYSPTLTSGATNDWDPSGGSGMATVGFANTTPNAAGSTVDGILAGSDKQQFMLCNAATLGTNGSYIILENQSSSETTAANRLLMAGNQALGPQMCAMLTYLAGSVNRWLVGRVMDSGTPATQPLASAASMTPDCSFKIVTETASASAFTVNAPTDCSPQNGQLLELDITNFTTVNAYTWNATYVGNATISLPSAGGAASKLDRILFGWDAATSTWDLKAYALGR